MNMKNRRDKTEIIALILESAKMNKITKSRIMYRAALSYAQLKAYLSLLLETGLLEYQKAERVYEITEKGEYFLHVYNQISKVTLPYDKVRRINIYILLVDGQTDICMPYQMVLQYGAFIASHAQI